MVPAAQDKIYNQTTAVTITNANLAGILLSDDVSIATSNGNFDLKNVGHNKTVTAALTIDGADAINYTLTQPNGLTADITPAPLTVSGITASNKVYDTTTAASPITTSAIYTGLLGSDAVSVSATGFFNNKNVGIGKTVNLKSNYTGADVANYAIVDQASTTANISRADLTLSGIAVANKVYDATTATTIDTTGAAYTGLLGSDVVTVSTTGLFDNKNVGTGKVVSLYSNYEGADRDNYTITGQATATATITKATLTVNATGKDRVYNATTDASVDFVDNRFAGDVLIVSGDSAFTSKTAGRDKDILVTGMTIAGTDATNYLVAATATATADITQKELVITSISADNKIYDGTLDAVISGGSITSGILLGDHVALGTLSGSFSDKNVGIAKRVSIVGGTLSGSDADNYLVTATEITTADITPRSITITANDITRVYGNATPQYGSVSADNLAVDDLLGISLLSSDATKSSNVGTYFLSSGLASFKQGSTSNYSISYADGELLIAPRQATVTANAALKIYGNIDPSLSYDIEGQQEDRGFLGGDYLSGSLTRVVGENVGSYAIGQGTIVNDNYAIDYVAAKLTINPARLTYVADAVNRAYGTANPLLTGKVVGFKNNETLASAITGRETYSTDATINSKVGSYAIYGDGLIALNSNYIFAQDINNQNALSVFSVPNPEPFSGPSSATIFNAKELGELSDIMKMPQQTFIQSRPYFSIEFEGHAYIDGNIISMEFSPDVKIEEGVTGFGVYYLNDERNKWESGSNYLD
ncbi:YDG domain-containing protein [Desulfotalea psychrophila]|uniref:Uncharacterized protein n=1 Tax=Desulfotalea psychrophila (strain LSv54 / DSM 12343) TaxID=177439 RepID=Q6AIC8_DESPS|nr:YDG domain-containing protein [Desulfotalea psychrophila]CAG37919.1 hypothetical protein DPPB55 [Desulfotalea psychrophila LSv54]